MKAYSQAQVRVVKGEEGGESKVEINGTPEAIWKVCHRICIIENCEHYPFALLKALFISPSGGCL